MGRVVFVEEAEEEGREKLHLNQFYYERDRFDLKVQNHSHIQLEGMAHHRLMTYWFVLLLAPPPQLM